MVVGFIFAAMYCVAVAALEMVGRITTGMAIDAYGPICDNVGCIAEMAALSHGIRKRIDVVDAAGKTTLKKDQEKDKIGSKPDKNGKRGKAGKNQKQLQ
nr:pyrophosphate-energized vacuolar membrane proton pump-like [Tanacetum cinerariifolium]